MTSLPLQHSAPSSRLGWRFIIEKLGPLLGLSFVFALFAILVPLHTGQNIFATLGNAELILRQTAIVGIAAVGMTVIIISGGIDLSVGRGLLLRRGGGRLLLSAGISPPMAGSAAFRARALCGLLTGKIITPPKIR